MRAVPPAGSVDSAAHAVGDDPLPSSHDPGRSGPDAGLDAGGESAWVVDEMLVAAVVAGAWFAIGTGIALMLAGRDAAIVDIAVALAAAVAGTIATLALLAHVAADDH